ncbi:hypothetical protein GC163_05585 [bacterium]|nr:hypothetical protein [bacterium]
MTNAARTPLSRSLGRPHRTSSRIGVGLLIAASVLNYGCGSNSGSGTSSSKEAPPAEEVYVRPLLKDWEPPAVALALSGELHGYLEPCGCSLTQSGGLERRGDLFRQLSEKGWNVVPLDAGDLLKRSRRQDQIKFEAILGGLKQLGYSTIGTGESELRLSADYLVSQFAGEGIPLAGMLTSANVTLFDAPDLGVPVPWRVIQAGDMKVGVIALLGKSAADEVAPEGVENFITIQPAVDALRATLPVVQAEKPDVLLVMSNGSLDEAQALAKEFPELPLILAGGGPEDPGDQPKKIGNTLILETGHKGKYVGILGYYPGDADPYRWELVNLDNRRFHGDEPMHQVMKSYQQQLQELELAKSPELVISHPSGTTFVGAKTCGECHAKAYSKWKGTKHAAAFESLARGRKGQEANWVSRIYDPECLCCHVTGWDPREVRRFDSGYIDQETTAHLAGQQCENCHGPGQAHIDLERQYRQDLKSVTQESLTAARTALKLNYKEAELKVCSKCHDDENSPGFKFEKYWDEVKHPWKD